MKYKISKVSKIVDIPIDTIRYFVKEGIITPQKKGEYYYYSAWDINFLLEYRRYRKFELSMAEIKEIIKNDNLETLTSRLENQQDYYLSKEKYYHLLASKNNNMIHKLKEIPKKLNAYDVVDIPEYYYFFHRHNYEYNIDDEELNKLSKTINKYYSFIDAMVFFDKDNFISTIPRNDYVWHIGIEKYYFDALNIDKTKDVKQTVKGRALHTLVYASDEGSFNIDLLNLIKKHINNNNYKVNGNIFGILEARVHEDHQYRRYINFYIPIE